MKLARFLMAIVLATVATIASSTKSTTLHIKNESTMDLEDVVLSGSGFQVIMSTLPAGAATNVSISSRGESGLAVSFVAEGLRVSAPEQGYFEGGGRYVGDVATKSDLSVSVEFRLAI